MDAVCVKGSWDVILAFDEEEQLEGVLVYHVRKYRGFTMLLMPPMTAYNGIYILDKLSDKHSYSSVSSHNRITETLIEQLPKHSLYYQQYHPSYENWLALYWKGYKQTTRYTYIMDSSIAKETAVAGLRDNLRRSIKNTGKHCELIDISFETFMAEAKKSFQSRSKAVPINEAVLKRLCDTFLASGELVIKACRHRETGALLSGAVFASDDTTTYYVSSFYHPSIKPTGSMAYVIWETIFSGEQRYFDFEGSIIKEVEFYFRSFGATLVPHHRIYKVPNALLNLGISVLKPQFFV